MRIVCKGREGGKEQCLGGIEQTLCWSHWKTFSRRPRLLAKLDNFDTAKLGHQRCPIWSILLSFGGFVSIRSELQQHTWCMDELIFEFQTIIGYVTQTGFTVSAFIFINIRLYTPLQ